MTPEEEIRRGLGCAALLNDPNVNAALTELRQEFMEAWATAPTRDAEGREHLHRLVQTLDALKGRLIAWRDGGRLVQATIDQQDRAIG